MFAAALYFAVRPQSGTAEFVKGPVVDVKSVVPDAAFVDQRADLVEVTLDPEFDTPRVLERYGRTFGADARRWHLLTGPPRRSNRAERRS